jgi:hypothetical protein
MECMEGRGTWGGVMDWWGGEGGGGARKGQEGRGEGWGAGVGGSHDWPPPRPRWGQAWLLYGRNMMGPSWPTMGPPMGSSLGPPWAHDGPKLGPPRAHDRPKLGDPMGPQCKVLRKPLIDQTWGPPVASPILGRWGPHYAHYGPKESAAVTAVVTYLSWYSCCYLLCLLL